MLYNISRLSMTNHLQQVKICAPCQVTRIRKYVFCSSCTGLLSFSDDYTRSCLIELKYWVEQQHYIFTIKPKAINLWDSCDTCETAAILDLFAVGDVENLHRTVRGKSFRAPMPWNKLSDYIKPQASKIVFVRFLKSFI